MWLYIPSIYVPVTGNGVVPLAAAYAFVSLWAALWVGVNRD